MMRSPWLVAPLVIALAAAGCSQSSELGEDGGPTDASGLDGADGALSDSATVDPDAAPRTDGGLPDGAPLPDGGLPDGEVPDGEVPFEGEAGEACETDEDCGGLLCLDGPAGADRCSFFCTPEIACPDGVCFEPGPDARVGFCVAGCADGCPEGTECIADPATGEEICRESCATDAECPGDSVCVVEGPVGRCRTPAAAVGGPCEGSSECGGGPTSCVREEDRGFPGGLCLQFGCGMPFISCPGGAACVRFERFGEICLASCDADTGCRAGYACREAAEGNRVCVPSCSSSAQCNDGRICDVLSGLCVDP